MAVQLLHVDLAAEALDFPLPLVYQGRRRHDEDHLIRAHLALERVQHMTAQGDGSCAAEGGIG